MAGTALAFALPMSFALLAFGRFGPEPSASARPMVAIPAVASAVPTDDAPRAWLSSEPPTTTLEEGPLVVPTGQIIPEPAGEEASHAGR